MNILTNENGDVLVTPDGNAVLPPNDTSEYLREPATGLAVGKYLKVLGIDSAGHAILEFVDEPGGGIAGVKVVGTELEPDEDGKVNIPAGNDQVKGVVRVSNYYGLWHPTQSGDGIIGILSSNESNVVSRLQPQGITVANYDLAVKHAMCDEGTASGSTLSKPLIWTDAEKTGAWLRLNTIKSTVDSVLVAGAKYLLGEQSTLSLTLPATAELGQQIEVVFYSGATATTLSVSGETIGDTPVPAANTRYELNFEWDGTYWSLLSVSQAVPQEEVV